MIKLPPLGQPLHKVEKLADESITYIFDLTDILNKNEVVTQITTSLPARSRKGKYVEITSTPIEVGGTNIYVDTIIKVLCKTTLGNTRSFSFIVRTFK